MKNLISIVVFFLLTFSIKAMNHKNIVSLHEDRFNELFPFPVQNLLSEKDYGSQAAACSINNFEVIPMNCDADIMAYMFDFESTDFGLNGYTVSNNLGWSQSYTTNDYKIFIIDAVCMQELEFIIKDNDNDMCADTFYITPECCECGFEFYLVEQTECVNGSFDAIFHFYWYLGSCGLYYDDKILTINGVEYAYTHLGNAKYYVENITTEDSEIYYTMTFPFPLNEFQTIESYNPCNLPCELNNFEVFAPSEQCTGELLLLEFDFESPFISESGYTILSNFGHEFHFNYTDERVFGIIADCANEYIFTLIDNDYLDCQRQFLFGTVCCACQASYFEIEQLSCVNNSFDAVHVLNYESGPCFTHDWILHINDIEHPFTWLNDNYFDILNISYPDSLLHYEVCQNTPGGICYYLTTTNPCFQPVQDCSLVFEEIGNPTCENDSINLSLIIVGQNISQTGFDVYVNDSFALSLPYEADSIYNILLPDPGTQGFILKICDNDTLDCCTERELENPCYEHSDECSLVFEELGNPTCSNDSINLSLIIDGQNISQSGFNVIVNDSFALFLPYEADSIYNIVLPDSGTQGFSLNICDNGTLDCCFEREFENPCFESNNDCSLVFEEIGNPTCENDSINLSLIIIGQNISQSGFNVYLDSSILLFLNYESDSMYQMFIPNPGRPFFNVTICDNDNPDCCQTHEFANPCYEPNIDCSLSFDTLSEPFCENDSVKLDLKIFGKNLSQTGFEVYLNGSLLTFLNFEADSFYLLALAAPSASGFVLTICDNDNTNCCQVYSFVNPCYTGPDTCNIFYEATSVLLCESGLIETSLTISSQHTSTTGYDVFVNDSLTIFLAFSPDSIYLLSFPAPETEEFIISVCDHENSACCRGQIFSNPCIPQGRCSINDLDSNAGMVGLDSMILEFHYTLEGVCQGPQTSTLWVGQYAPVEILVFEQYIKHKVPKVHTETFPVKLCFSESPDTCLTFLMTNPFTTGIHQEADKSVSFFWSDGDFYVTNQGQPIQNLMIYDNIGRMVYSTGSILKEFSTSVIGIKSGLYHIIYFSGDKQYHRKFLLLR